MFDHPSPARVQTSNLTKTKKKRSPKKKMHWDHELLAMLTATFCDVQELKRMRLVSSSWRDGVRLCVGKERCISSLCELCNCPSCVYVSHTRALVEQGIWTDDVHGEWSCQLCASSPRFPTHNWMLALTIQILWQICGECYFALLRILTDCERPSWWVAKKIIPVTFAPRSSDWVPSPSVPLWVQVGMLTPPD